MRAVRLAEFGLENIQVDDVADPVAAAGEVLIATEAATVNPADFGMVTGGMASFLPPGIKPPYTPGWDLAGRVVALGAGVEDSLLASRVVGFSTWIEAGRGTQASLVALPVPNVAVAPDDGLPSANLTTVGLNGLTAWRAIDELSLVAGETLVIAGAGGSVGGFALELAVDRGISVIAAVPDSDREYVLGLGASEVAAREAGGTGATVRAILPGGADALLDTTTTLGNTGLGAIRDGGRYVTTTDPPEAERDITVTKIYGGPHGAALTTLIEMAARGRLHTPVAKEFVVSDARAAYEEFASGPHRGRIVLTF
jgi:NADPH:quinone reductase-like Zn-dependent oxidoreductase